MENASHNPNSLLCRLGLHRWGAWKQYEVTMTRVVKVPAGTWHQGPPSHDCLQLRQKRYCDRCNRMQDNLLLK